MSDQPQTSGSAPDENRIVVITPEGMGVASSGRGDGEGRDGREETNPADLVEQPAKVMRIGSMIKNLLDEVRNAPLDEAGRLRLAEIHRRSIDELKDGLAPELVEELDRIALPFGAGAPSDAELRIAQAQLVGWLEGLFHGIQTALVAQQMAAQQQLAGMRRALPPELRQNPPLHQIALLRHPDEPGIAILAVNGDGSLTLADNLENDATITWAIRQPLAAEQQMRGALTTLAARHPQPAFALMFSCIGRGPLFYGNDDRDLLAFREAFPATPLLGAYGSSQIFPHAGKNRLYHNAALTLLFESTHV